MVAAGAVSLGLVRGRASGRTINTRVHKICVDNGLPASSQIMSLFVIPPMFAYKIKHMILIG